MPAWLRVWGQCDSFLQAMQVQNHVWGPAIMTFITAAANIPINIILIRYYGFWGAALATSVARILLLILLCGEMSLLSSFTSFSSTFCDDIAWTGSNVAYW